MERTSSSFLLAIIAINVVCFTADAAQRWCQLSEGDEVLYDDQLSICSTCGNLTTLFKNALKTNVFPECCDGELKMGCDRSGECTTLTLACTNSSNFYCKSDGCDGYNDCGNGGDELKTSDDDGCEACSDGQYTCRSASNRFKQCFSISHVCDGVKDCFSGSDEENCPHHTRTRCTGFRCLHTSQCLGRKQVCDGMKDCLDGSDEVECVLNDQFCGSDRFMCASAPLLSSATCRPVPATQVCDGNPDCFNGKDEENCHAMTSWSTWSECECDVASDDVTKMGSRSRTRKCVIHNDPIRHYPDKCPGEESVLHQICTCEEKEVKVEATTQAVDTTTTKVVTSSLSETIVVVIILSCVIVLVMLGCATYTIVIAAHQRRQHVDKNDDVIIGGGIVPSIGASSIVSGPTFGGGGGVIPRGSALGVTNHAVPSVRYSTLSATQRSTQQQQRQLPPTPSSDELYASIDEMAGNMKRSMSLMSIDEVANPQAIADTPYDIPRGCQASGGDDGNGTGEEQSKRGRSGMGSRLIRAISRKMSIKPNFRRALSSDQLNHNFASTRTLLLRHQTANQHQPHLDDDDPQSNYMTMCGGRMTPADTISMLSRTTTNDQPPVVPLPPTVQPSTTTTRRRKSPIRRESFKIATNELDLQLSRLDSFLVTDEEDDDEDVHPPPIPPQQKVDPEDEKEKNKKKEPTYTRVIPRSLRRQESILTSPQPGGSDDVIIQNQ